MHILGGLEKDSNTGAISTDPENHDLMCHLRAEKVAKIPVPDVEVQGCADDADLLIVGFGGTYGLLVFGHGRDEQGRQEGGPRPLHLSESAPQEHGNRSEEVQEGGSCRTESRTICGYLRMKIDNFTPYQFNEVKGQPFVVAELVAAFNKLIDN